jgi:hypothetical protein
MQATLKELEEERDSMKHLLLADRAVHASTRDDDGRQQRPFEAVRFKESEA